MFSQRQKSRKKCLFANRKIKEKRIFQKEGTDSIFSFPFSASTHTQSFPFFSSFLIFLSHLSAAGKKRRRKKRGGKGPFFPLLLWKQLENIGDISG